MLNLEQPSSPLNNWFVFDCDGNIEVSGRTKEEAEEITADLRAFEPESDWQCAEDKAENGEVEEA